MTVRSGMLAAAAWIMIIVGVILLVIFVWIYEDNYKYKPCVPVWLKVLLVISFVVLIVGLLLALASGLAKTSYKNAAHVVEEKKLKSIKA